MAVFFYAAFDLHGLYLESGVGASVSGRLDRALPLISRRPGAAGAAVPTACFQTTKVAESGTDRLIEHPPKYFPTEIWLIGALTANPLRWRPRLALISKEGILRM